MVSEKFVEMKIFSENVALFSMKLLVTTCWFLIEEFTAIKATAVELFDPDEIIEKELSYFLSSSSLQDIDYITQDILNGWVHFTIKWVNILLLILVKEELASKNYSDKIGPLEDMFSLIKGHPCEVTRSSQVYEAPLINSEDELSRKICSCKMFSGEGFM